MTTDSWCSGVVRTYLVESPATVVRGRPGHHWLCILPTLAFRNSLSFNTMPQTYVQILVTVFMIFSALILMNLLAAIYVDKLMQARTYSGSACLMTASMTPS